jgi:hypothetical protein
MPLKTLCHYSKLHSVVAVGENVVLVPTDHTMAEFNGGRIVIGPVLNVIPRFNDERPVFETHYCIFVPVDSPAE